MNYDLQDNSDRKRGIQFLPEAEKGLVKMGNRTADEILDQVIGKKKSFWGKSQQFVRCFLILLNMEFNTYESLSPQNIISRNELARSSARRTKDLGRERG